MAKLLPPSIESKLPAQTGDTLRIPFLHNRSVSPAQYDGLALKIKATATNLEVAILTVENKPEHGAATFSSKWIDQNTDGEEIQKTLIKGQYYKAQLAYYTIDSEGEKEYGYFSTTGVFKYTASPIIYISNDNNEQLRINGKNYINGHVYGIYEVPKINEGDEKKEFDDTTERVYSYKFNIYKDNILNSSTGSMLHNSSNDKEAASSFDEYMINDILDNNSNYQIEYEVLTSNGLIVKSPKYPFAYGMEVPGFGKEFSLVSELNQDNGTINIFINSTKPVDFKGKYRLVRFNQENNIRETIAEFQNSASINGKYLLFADNTVMQGKTYAYGLQKYNSTGVTTNFIVTNSIKVDFEDMFLSDADFQLNIKFNPKVTSFKTTVLENKLDTLGGKYPFVFRNGRVNYKEFPISGLISYWMNGEDIVEVSRTSTGARNEDATSDFRTDLTNDNVTLEREFKLRVLEWLNNGKPKLFRSPAEGNYIVRLMNISLSPEEKLGRMLHTFNSQAYEIAENSFQNLQEYNLLNKINNNIEQTTDFAIYQFNNIEDSCSLNDAIWCRLYGEVYSRYDIEMSNGNIEQIQIGITGQYEVHLEDTKINKVTLVYKPEIPILGISYELHYANNLVKEEPITYNINNTEYAVLSMKTIETMSELTPEDDESYDIIMELNHLNNDGNVYYKLDKILHLRLFDNRNDSVEPVIKFIKNGKMTETYFSVYQDEFIGNMTITTQDDELAYDSIIIPSSITAQVYYIQSIMEVEEL